MKVAFFSNFLNHHQLPMCKEFISQGVDFTFVATESIPFERLNMGYEDMNAYPFVLRAYESKENEEKAFEIATTYDLVIIGSAPLSYINARMNKNLITFRFCERPLKKGAWRRFIPPVWKKLSNEYIKHKNKNLFILGASAYTKKDLVFCGFNGKKCFNWGYFPEVKKYDDINAVINSKDKNSLLWVARFLKLKHPEAPIKTAKWLKDDGYSFVLNMIGTGEEQDRAKMLVKKYGLEDCVKFLDSMSPEEVRLHMENSQIFMFTSDRNEGWGAVMNEAMNSGCAVVANDQIGSVPYLVKDGINGFSYKNGVVKELYRKVKSLLDDKELTASFGRTAYDTLNGVWNAHTAVKGLLKAFAVIKEGIDNGDDYNTVTYQKLDEIKKDWLN